MINLRCNSHFTDAACLLCCHPFPKTLMSEIAYHSGFLSGFGRRGSQPPPKLRDNP